jgi:hypothetical protein
VSSRSEASPFQGMVVRYCFSVVVFISLCATSVRAGDAIDTRVTFTVADDDITKGPEESTTGSPSTPNFVPSRANRLFYDDYERRDTGFENLTHFVLYAQQPGFFAGVDTEAALVLRAEFLQNQTVSIKDDGSYIRLIKNLDASKLSLTAFPISAHRFMLGYSYSIAWGGSGIFKSNASPGLKLQWDTDGAYAFAGVKTALSQMKMSDGTVENDTVWGVLGGGGVDITNEFRLEGGTGYFRRGTIDKPDLTIPDGHGRLKTAPWDGFGGSAQVVYHVGIPIGIPIDFRLYRNDPLKHEEFFKSEQYSDGLSYVVQSEFNVLGQTLQDPERPSATRVQRSMAGDFTAKVKVGKTRLFALAVYRDLGYVLFNVPSNPPFSDFPKGLQANPEFFGYLGVDYFLEDMHVTPGCSFGVQRPANIRSAANAGNNASQTLGAQTMIFRTDTDTEVLNPGESVSLIFAGKATARWDISTIVSAVGEIQVSYDRNRRLLAQDENGIPVRIKADPQIIGFTGMLQARF